MMSRKIKSALLSSAVFAVSVFTLTGCGLRSESNDNGLASAQFASDEIANMSIDAANTMDGAGLSKESATAAETTYISRTIHPYSWNADIQAFVRNASFSTSNGYERNRTDTVIFKDAAGVSLRYPSLASVSTISHVRRVTHVRGGLEANVLFNISFVVDKSSSDTTLVKNGTMSGTYGDESFASGTAVNVTRHRVNGAWQFPESGTIQASFPRYTYSVVYNGNGSATATVTNLVKDKTTVTTIQVDQR